jgi:hypothetical protein
MADARWPSGTPVEVRNRFDRRWISGFEVEEVGPEEQSYRVRRISDRAVLPVSFAAGDVRRGRR